MSSIGLPLGGRSLGLNQSTSDPVAEICRRGLRQSCGRGGFGNLAGFDMTGHAGLGAEDPHDAVVRERTDCIHECIDQVTVSVAPPQQHNIDHLVGILVEGLPTDRIFYVGAQIIVGVLVPAQLLYDHVASYAKFLSVVLSVRRGDHGGDLLELWVQ